MILPTTGATKCAGEGMNKVGNSRTGSGLSLGINQVRNDCDFERILI